MQLSINGEEKSFSQPLNLDVLKTHLSLDGAMVAIELNGSVIPRSQHAEVALKTGDTIEIIHAIGGG